MGEVEIRLQNINTGSFETNSSELSGDGSEGSETIESIPVPVTADETTESDNVTSGAVDEQKDAAEASPASDDITSAEADEIERASDENEGASDDSAEPDDTTLIAAMEAILFAMGDAVSVDSLSKALGVSRERTLEAADTLAERCRQPGSGVSLNWYEDCIQLSTKPELYEYLIRIAAEPKKPRLTPTLLETLSIIAFRQPVTRMEVENIRGVNSDFAISRLVSFDLVQEVGRKEVPGRPLLFGTTQQFLRSFGIRSVEELPEPDSSRIESFREEAEEEVSSKLDI